jgi:hypothetical protein
MIEVCSYYPMICHVRLAGDIVMAFLIDPELN